MSTFHFNSGEAAMIRGSIYECLGRGPGGKNLFVAQSNRSSLYLSPEEIFDLYDKGKFRKVESHVLTNTFSQDTSYTYDLSSEPAHVRLEVLERKFYMNKIREYINDGGKLSERHLKPLLKEAFNELIKQSIEDQKDEPKKPLSCSAAKRWYKNWRESGFEVISLVRERRGNTSSRLPLEIREIMEDIINTRYLSKLRITAKKAYREIISAVHILNKKRKQQQLPQLKSPSYETVLKHIEKLDEYEKLAARFGHEYASKMTRPYGITPIANRTLERVQMDHTQIDIYVDMGQEYLLRPHLTLAVDSYSKAILGYWISIDPPSAESVMNCLNVAIMKKDVVALGGDIQWNFPMHGIPTELTLDNGKDFYSNDLEVACAQLGITLNYTPPRKPYYKSQIERKFGEINTSLFTSMPGRVYKDEPEKRDKDYPYLTFDAFHRIFLQWMTTVLHRTPNQEGNTPVDLWFKSEAKFGVLPCPYDANHLSITLGKTITNRTLGLDGIRHNNLRFNNDALSRLRRSLHKPNGNNPKIVCKWNASDVGVIWVLDEMKNQYFRVPAIQSGAHGRSLFRHKVIHREMRERKKAGLSDASYIEAENALDIAIQEATNTGNTKSQTRISRFKSGKTRVKPLVKAPKLNPDDEFINFESGKAHEDESDNGNQSNQSSDHNNVYEADEIIDFSGETRELA